ncbi:hypothetical protein OX284_010095 [Flavobacterium sp. SUN046]|uniref:hypothetical protein n=1 Tax=Flavobacterium sp. SUN046 TaxID=3002440 RepID=UPI002DBF82B5|nr:hypothetical protein [Flavobacterium sp. SUN046]MEC4049778.1 hypothetical protein [Flavobacterium sp. SUN046]
MKQTLTPIDEIKDLYSQVKEKTKFIINVSPLIGRAPKTLRNHWFSEFWSIPKEHQPRVKELLETTIKNQA